jgi:hypothetical protein
VTQYEGGLGVFAKRDIKKGEMLLIEEAIFIVQDGQSE